LSCSVAPSTSIAAELELLELQLELEVLEPELELLLVLRASFC
jgi:hypothetical protein